MPHFQSKENNRIIADSHALTQIEKLHTYAILLDLKESGRSQKENLKNNLKLKKTQTSSRRNGQKKEKWKRKNSENMLIFSFRNVAQL